MSTDYVTVKNNFLVQSADGKSVVRTPLPYGFVIPADAVNIQARLLTAIVWNTVPNVVAGRNNALRLSGKTLSGMDFSSSVMFPTGLYDVPSLNKWLKRALATFPADIPSDWLEIEGDSATNKLVFSVPFKTGYYPVTITIGGLAIDERNNMAELLGFDPAGDELIVAPGVPGLAPRKAKFNNINSFRILNDIVGRGLQINGEYEGCLAQIPIVADTGSQVEYAPTYPVAIDLTGIEGSSRYEMRSSLTTETGELATTGEPWSYVFEITYEHPKRNLTNFLTQQASS